jgi:hypothetical protein
MSICVICGKSYKTKVTDSHLKSHKISEKKHAAMVDALPQAAWEFYWSDDEDKAPIRKIFPNPLESRGKVWKGFLTYEDWGRSRHPEWW